MSNASGTPRTPESGSAQPGKPTARTPAPRSSGETDTPAAPGTVAPGTPAPGAPEPEPLRFFGTTWVEHDGGYAARRLGVAAGALVAAAAGALVLVLACQGLAAAEGGLVNVLLVAVIILCSLAAFRRTWSAFGARPDAPRESSQRGFTAIGFLGVLLAYALRCLVEAPGERLHRTEYERAREEHARRTARRAGNPAARRKRK